MSDELILPSREERECGLRLECLRLAVCGVSEAPDDIVRRAKLFSDFVLGNLTEIVWRASDPVEPALEGEDA